jgi:hypothetical protein
VYNFGVENSRFDADSQRVPPVANPSFSRDSQSLFSSDVAQRGAFSPYSAISKALSRLKAAAAAAKVLARNERFAAETSEAILRKDIKTKNVLIARASSAIKAASAATAEAKALKEKLAGATAAAQRLSKEARAAHSTYVVGRRAAETIKIKASSMTKQAGSLLRAAEAAAAKAAAAKQSLRNEEANLAAARKQISANSSSLQKLSAAFAKAQASNEAAKINFEKEYRKAMSAEALDAAKESAAENAAKAADSVLHSSLKASLVANKNMLLAAQNRMSMQAVVTEANEANAEANAALDVLQAKAAQSRAAFNAAFETVQ